MSTVQRAVEAPRAVLSLGVVLAILAFWQPASDPVGLPKVAALAVCAGIAAGAVLGRAVSRASLDVPRSPVLVAMAALAAALVLAAVRAPFGWLAWAGSYGRWTGAGTYLLYLAFGTLVAWCFDRRSLPALVRALLVAGGLVAVYGILQRLGADPWGWEPLFGRSVHSTLGNPNFAGAALGILAPLAVWQTVRARSAAGRAAAGALLLAGAVTVWLTDTFQGPITAAIGLAVLLAAWLCTQPQRRRLVGLGALAALPVFSAVVVLAGGLLPRFVEGGHLDLRAHYWSAGWSMFTEQPLLGAGVNHFEAFYRLHTAEAATLRLGSHIVADQPHSVPLSMLVSGGLLLGLAYLVVVVATGWAVVVAWRRAVADGGDPLFVGALAGAWVAYHAQSAISIDAPTLAMLHWTLVGAIVVLAARAPRTYRLPWSAAAKGRRGRSRRGAGWVAGALVALLLATPVLWLVRADLAAGAGRRATTPGAAADSFERATSAVPWEATYHLAEGQWYAQREDPDGALDAFERAARRAPWALQGPMSAARASESLGQPDRAAGWYDEALSVEPTDPGIRFEAALSAGRAGDLDRARDLLEGVLAIDPDHEEARSLLEQFPGG